MVTGAPERNAAAACWTIAMPSGVIVSLSQSKNTRNTLRATSGGAGAAGGAATGAGPKRMLRLATRLCELEPEVEFSTPKYGVGIRPMVVGKLGSGVQRKR